MMEGIQRNGFQPPKKIRSITPHPRVPFSVINRIGKKGIRNLLKLL